LVGTDEECIVREAAFLLDHREAYEAMAHVHNPYGDGLASGRISQLIHSFLTTNS
jgi:UDP-N-acetylglucosamine 2-epimerase (non-hydrolysing)